MTEIQNMLDAICPSDYYYLAQMFYISLERLCKIRNDDLHRQILRQIQYSKYILLNGQTSQTICLLLRHYCGYNQEEMAKLMGIGRTNYRSIEKKTENLNSHNVFMLYKVFHIPPMLVLKDDIGIWTGMAEIMNQLKPEDKSEIITILKKNL